MCQLDAIIAAPSLVKPLPPKPEDELFDLAGQIVALVQTAEHGPGKEQIYHLQEWED